MRKGVTLIELVVAMALFIIIATLAMGAYVTVSNMKALANATRESQQKMRISTEVITRQAKQANVVKINSAGTEMELFFETTSPANRQGTRFVITANNIRYYDRCTVAITVPNISCANWGSTYEELFPINLEILSGSSFIKDASGGLPKLKITLVGRYNRLVNNPYYRSDFNLETSVILEGIR